MKTIDLEEYMNELEFKEQYLGFYKNVKEKIIASKIKAVRSANKVEYWEGNY